MKAKSGLVMFFVVLLAVSALLLGIIYLYLPVGDVVNRQLLFGLIFQIWGILATILIVKKILDMRDTQRWQAINQQVFNWLYVHFWISVEGVLRVFKVKIDVKASPTIVKFGVEYMNPESSKEWQQKAAEELRKVIKSGAETVKKNMESFKPSDHKELAKVVESLETEINELLTSFPHQIPPEFLVTIVNVRERAKSIRKQSGTMANTNVIDKAGLDYKELNTGMIEKESEHVHKFFSELLKLLEILEKNISPEFRP